MQRAAGVLKALGNPQDNVPSIHVAGTNGKGSVCAAVAAILRKSGARVGLTTSPHLTRVNERIAVNGALVADNLLNEYALIVKRAAERKKEDLSFFDVITLSAFTMFSDLRMDWIVLETGLGGRQDATNAISKPEVAVIVTIDHDHGDILGGTLEEIAGEKAGIIKKECQVVTGSIPPGPLKCISGKIEREKAAHWAYGRDFGASGNAGELRTACDHGFYSDAAGWSFEFVPSLRGAHQIHNMKVAIAAAKLAGASKDDCLYGVQNVFWPGRLERFQIHQREIYLDCAHNPAGTRTLADFLRKSGMQGVVLGFGALRSKNWREMMEILSPQVWRWALLKPDSPLAVDPQLLAGTLSLNEASADSYGADYERFIRCEMDNDDNRPLVVTGSIYLVGRIREIILNSSSTLAQTARPSARDSRRLDVF